MTRSQGLETKTGTRSGVPSWPELVEVQPPFQSSPPFQGGDRTNRRSGDLFRGGFEHLGPTAPIGPLPEPPLLELLHGAPAVSSLNKEESFAWPGNKSALQVNPFISSFSYSPIHDHAMALRFSRRSFRARPNPADVVAEAHHYVGNRFIAFGSKAKTYS